MLLAPPPSGAHHRALREGLRHQPVATAVAGGDQVCHAARLEEGLITDGGVQGLGGGGGVERAWWGVGVGNQVAFELGPSPSPSPPPHPTPNPTRWPRTFENFLISMSPCRMMVAFELGPSPSPSTMPAASATMFFSVPHISAPAWGSGDSEGHLGGGRGGHREH